jgi:hypothetical protein
MRYADYQTQDRRLVLLKGLEASAQYRANAFLLRRYADAVGHMVSADILESDLAWLAEQGLLTSTSTNEGGVTVTVATLTMRGLDVATGRAFVPGVQRPAPGG